MPVTMDTVYFYKFNNYYNRILKRYDTIEDYGTPMATQSNCNFVHGDGVNSTFYYNKAVGSTDTPDYVIVKDYNNNISRWFVTNSFKSRDRQDKLVLRRDLIADYYSDIINHSPCLIRKGYVPDNNPLVFNDEGVKYNKIKEDEILIKDESNCSYIVGFISNNAAAQNGIKGTIKDLEADYYFTSLSDIPFKDYIEGAGNNHTQACTLAKNNSFDTRVCYALRFSARRKISTSEQWNVEFFITNNGLVKPTGITSIYSNLQGSSIYYNSGAMAYNTRIEADADIDGPGAPVADRSLALGGYVNEYMRYFNINYYKIKESAKSILGLEEYYYENTLSQYIGKKINIGGTVYTVSIGKENETTRDYTYSTRPGYPTSWSDIKDGFNAYQPSDIDLKNSVPSNKDLQYITGYDKYNSTDNDIRIICPTEDRYLVLSEAVVDITTDVDSPSNRTHLTEQPYDMFMLINESNISYKVGVNSYVSNHEVNINMAEAICQAYGTAAYDIQIVPFNPMRGTILADGTLNFYNFDVHTIEDADSNVVGHYIMCSTADLKFTLTKDELKLLPDNYKKDYNLKEYRLCSPNQETIFEFSPSVNYGVNSWEITANYRPFTSYIKVQPTWGGLYGESNYNGLTDFRGLVYNSSLCVTQLSDAYSNYIANNKNFQQLFDNQINTLTKQQEIQVNALEETLGLRSYTGMPIGSILRVIGGAKDIDMTKELNNLAITKMETDFKYQMDNIKSMPHSIKKMTAINGDTRIFPFIEIYTASAVEENSFDLKMKYTGYTIMTTGYIYNYLKDDEETFVQADLIRLDLSRSEETADNHIATEIANELAKGLYITKESD